MRYNIPLSTFLLSILIVCSCQAANASNLVKSDKPYNTAPMNASDETFISQIKGNNQFAFDLYSQLKSSDGNIFFSPFSISTALAMTYEGARGNTEKQMRDALKFIEPKKDLHKAFNTLDLMLQRQMQDAKKSDPKSAFRLEIANSIWAQRDFNWLSSFLDVLAVNYNAGIYTVDFIKAAEQARIAINKWVEGKTHEKIKDLIQPGVLDDTTRMVLVNAIYFYGQWLYEFKKEDTYDEPFSLLDGSQVNVPMMHHTEHHNYYKGEIYEALELEYKDCEVVMDIILPEMGKFTEFESQLSNMILEEIITNMKPTEIILTMPKFKSDATFELSKTLKAMGMTDAFNPNAADFSGMDGEKDLFISEVIHKAYVAVDEKGTEAAAATAVVMKLSAAPVEQGIVVKIDRPFIYMIRDKKSGAVLFLGRVLDPR